MRDLSEKYFPVIKKSLASPLSVKLFCERNGINTKTFYYWKKKYLERKPKGFAPISILETEEEKPITIHYTDGTRLVFEGGMNASLIKELLPVFAR